MKEEDPRKVEEDEGEMRTRLRIRNTKCCAVRLRKQKVKPAGALLLLGQPLEKEDEDDRKFALEALKEVLGNTGESRNWSFHEREEYLQAARRTLTAAEQVRTRPRQAHPPPPSVSFCSFAGCNLFADETLPVLDVSFVALRTFIL